MTNRRYSGKYLAGFLLSTVLAMLTACTNQTIDSGDPVVVSDVIEEPGKNQALAEIRGFENISDDTLLAIKNHYPGPTAELSKIRNLEYISFDTDLNYASYILLMPCNEGSQIRLEPLIFEDDGTLSVDHQNVITIENTPDHYALLVKIYLAEHVPHFQAVVAYEGQEARYYFNDANGAGYPLPLVIEDEFTYYVESEQEPGITAATASIYAPDAESTYFAAEQTDLPGLTPEALIAALAAKGVLLGETKVQHFSIHESDGQKLVDLDLSAEYLERILSLGTAGEYAAVGSVCNTFLDAYDADQIKITVDGSGFESGHAEYWDDIGD